MEQKAPDSSPPGNRKRRSSAARPLLRKRSSAFFKTSTSSSTHHESSVLVASDATNKKPRPPLGAYNLFFRHERNNIMNGTTSSLASSVLSGRGCSSEQLLRDIMSDGAITSTSANSPSSQPSGGGAGGAKRHAELTKLVSSRWRVLDAPSRAIYDGLALLERKKYERAMERWAKEEERRRRQQEEEFLSSSSSQLGESAGEDSSSSGSDGDEEKNKNSEKKSCINRAEKRRRAIAIARLPKSMKSASTAEPTRRCNSLLLVKGTTPSYNPQTLSSEPDASSSISALRMSILKRKRQLQRDAEKEYHKLANAKASSCKVASRMALKAAATSCRIGHEEQGEEVESTESSMIRANHKTSHCHGRGKRAGTTAAAGEESAVDADNDWTERDAAMILEAIPSDVADGEEDAENFCSDDTLRLLTEAFAAEDDELSSATVAGCGKEEPRNSEDEERDNERMKARLYDPIPVVGAANNNSTAASTGVNHVRSMHNDSVPSLHSSISSLTGQGGIAALTRDQVFHANTAPASSSGSHTQEDELDGESVRFLASIFGARSA